MGRLAVVDEDGIAVIKGPPAFTGRSQRESLDPAQQFLSGLQTGENGIIVLGDGNYIFLFFFMRIMFF